MTRSAPRTTALHASSDRTPRHSVERFVNGHGQSFFLYAWRAASPNALRCAPKLVDARFGSTVAAICSGVGRSVGARIAPVVMMPRWTHSSQIFGNRCLIAVNSSSPISPKTTQRFSILLPVRSFKLGRSQRRRLAPLAAAIRGLETSPQSSCCKSGQERSRTTQTLDAQSGASR